MSPKSWYQINNKADGDVEILIYDEISYWGVDAATFARELAAVDTDKLTVRINSPGGNVFDGIAILNALRSHKATVKVVIDGLAASAASFIAMAGDEIVMSRNSEMMIHEASGICVGNSTDMREIAERLDRTGENIASMYADRAGGTVESWRAAMVAETWYSDQEAVDAGLADRIEAPPNPSKADKSATKNAFDLSTFNYAGRRAAPTPTIAPILARTTNSSAAEVEADKKEGHMATLQEALAERLGISADADEATVLAAVDEALAEQVEDSSVSEPNADQVAEFANRNGLVLVDRAQHDEIVAGANEGRQARAQQLRDSDELLVTNAINAGKFGPSRREHWLNALEKDREGMTAAINSLADGLVPLSEIGHAQAVETASDDATYAALFGNEA